MSSEFDFLDDFFSEGIIKSSPPSSISSETKPVNSFILPNLNLEQVEKLKKDNLKLRNRIRLYGKALDQQKTRLTQLLTEKLALREEQRKYADFGKKLEEANLCVEATAQLNKQLQELSNAHEKEKEEWAEKQLNLQENVKDLKKSLVDCKKKEDAVKRRRKKYLKSLVELSEELIKFESFPKKYNRLYALWKRQLDYAEDQDSTFDFDDVSEGPEKPPVRIEFLSPKSSTPKKLEQNGSAVTWTVMSESEISEDETSPSKTKLVLPSEKALLSKLGITSISSPSDKLAPQENSVEQVTDEKVTKTVSNPVLKDNNQNPGVKTKSVVFEGKRTSPRKAKDLQGSISTVDHKSSTENQNAGVKTKSVVFERKRTSPRKAKDLQGSISTVVEKSSTENENAGVKTRSVLFEVKRTSPRKAKDLKGSISTVDHKSSTENQNAGVKTKSVKVKDKRTSPRRAKDVKGSISTVNQKSSTENGECDMEEDGGNSSFSDALEANGMEIEKNLMDLEETSEKGKSDKQSSSDSACLRTILEEMVISLNLLQPFDDSKIPDGKAEEENTSQQIVSSSPVNVCDLTDHVGTTEVVGNLSSDEVDDDSSPTDDWGILPSAEEDTEDSSTRKKVIHKKKSVGSKPGNRVLEMMKKVVSINCNSEIKTNSVDHKFSSIKTLHKCSDQSNHSNLTDHLSVNHKDAVAEKDADVVCELRKIADTPCDSGRILESNADVNPPFSDLDNIPDSGFNSPESPVAEIGELSVLFEKDHCSNSCVTDALKDIVSLRDSVLSLEDAIEHPYSRDVVVNVVTVEEPEIFPQTSKNGILKEDNYIEEFKSPSQRPKKSPRKGKSLLKQSIGNDNENCVSNVRRSRRFMKGAEEEEKSLASGIKTRSQLQMQEVYISPKFAKKTEITSSPKLKNLQTNDMVASSCGTSSKMRETSEEEVYPSDTSFESLEGDDEAKVPENGLKNLDDHSKEGEECSMLQKEIQASISSSNKETDVSCLVPASENVEKLNNLPNTNSQVDTAFDNTNVQVEENEVVPYSSGYERLSVSDKAENNDKMSEYEDDTSDDEMMSCSSEIDDDEDVQESFGRKHLTSDGGQKCPNSNVNEQQNSIVNNKIDVNPAKITDCSHPQTSNMVEKEISSMVMPKIPPERSDDQKENLNNNNQMHCQMEGVKTSGVESVSITSFNELNIECSTPNSKYSGLPKDLKHAFKQFLDVLNPQKKSNKSIENDVSLTGSEIHSRNEDTNKNSTTCIKEGNSDKEMSKDLEIFKEAEEYLDSSIHYPFSSKHLSFLKKPFNSPLGYLVEGNPKPKSSILVRCNYKNPNKDVSGVKLNDSSILLEHEGTLMKSPNTPVSSTPYQFTAPKSLSKDQENGVKKIRRNPPSARKPKMNFNVIKRPVVSFFFGARKPNIVYKVKFWIGGHFSMESFVDAYSTNKTSVCGFVHGDVVLNGITPSPPKFSGVKYSKDGTLAPLSYVDQYSLPPKPLLNLFSKKPNFSAFVVEDGDLSLTDNCGEKIKENITDRPERKNSSQSEDQVPVKLGVLDESEGNCHINVSDAVKENTNSATDWLCNLDGSENTNPATNVAPTSAKENANCSENWLGYLDRSENANPTSDVVLSADDDVLSTLSSWFSDSESVNSVVETQEKTVETSETEKDINLDSSELANPNTDVLLNSEVDALFISSSSLSDGESVITAVETQGKADETSDIEMDSNLDKSEHANPEADVEPTPTKENANYAENGHDNLDRSENANPKADVEPTLTKENANYADNGHDNLDRSENANPEADVEPTPTKENANHADNGHDNLDRSENANPNTGVEPTPTKENANYAENGHDNLYRSENANPKADVEPTLTKENANYADNGHDNLDRSENANPEADVEPTPTKENANHADNGHDNLDRSENANPNTGVEPTPTKENANYAENGHDNLDRSENTNPSTNVLLTAGVDAHSIFESWFNGSKSVNSVEESQEKFVESVETGMDSSSSESQCIGKENVTSPKGLLVRDSGTKNSSSCSADTSSVSPISSVNTASTEVNKGKFQRSGDVLPEFTSPKDTELVRPNGSQRNPSSMNIYKGEKLKESDIVRKVEDQFSPSGIRKHSLPHIIRRKSSVTPINRAKNCVVSTSGEMSKDLRSSNNLASVDSLAVPTDGIVNIYEGEKLKESDIVRKVEDQFSPSGIRKHSLPHIIRRKSSVTPINRAKSCVVSTSGKVEASEDLRSSNNLASVDSLAVPTDDIVSSHVILSKEESCLSKRKLLDNMESNGEPLEKKIIRKSKKALSSDESFDGIHLDLQTSQLSGNSVENLDSDTPKEKVTSASDLCTQKVILVSQTESDEDELMIELDPESDGNFIIGLGSHEVDKHLSEIGCSLSADALLDSGFLLHDVEKQSTKEAVVSTKMHKRLNPDRTEDELDAGPTLHSPNENKHGNVPNEEMTEPRDSESNAKTGDEVYENPPKKRRIAHSPKENPVSNISDNPSSIRADSAIGQTVSESTSLNLTDSNSVNGILVDDNIIIVGEPEQLLSEMFGSPTVNSFTKLGRKPRKQTFDKLRKGADLKHTPHPQEVYKMLFGDIEDVVDKVPEVDDSLTFKDPDNLCWDLNDSVDKLYEKTKKFRIAHTPKTNAPEKSTETDLSKFSQPLARKSTASSNNEKPKLNQSKLEKLRIQIAKARGLFQRKKDDCNLPSTSNANAGQVTKRKVKTNTDTDEETFEKSAKAEKINMSKSASDSKAAQLDKGITKDKRSCNVKKHTSKKGQVSTNESSCYEECEESGAEKREMRKKANLTSKSKKKLRDALFTTESEEVTSDEEVDLMKKKSVNTRNRAVKSKCEKDRNESNMKKSPVTPNSYVQESSSETDLDLSVNVQKLISPKRGLKKKLAQEDEDSSPKSSKIKTDGISPKKTVTRKTDKGKKRKASAELFDSESPVISDFDSDRDNEKTSQPVLSSMSPKCVSSDPSKNICERKSLFTNDSVLELENVGKESNVTPATSSEESKLNSDKGGNGKEQEEILENIEVPPLSPLSSDELVDTFILCRDGDNDDWSPMKAPKNDSDNSEFSKLPEDLTTDSIKTSEISSLGESRALIDQPPAECTGKESQEGIKDIFFNIVKRYKSLYPRKQDSNPDDKKALKGLLGKLSKKDYRTEDMDNLISGLNDERRKFKSKSVAKYLVRLLSKEDEDDVQHPIVLGAPRLSETQLRVLSLVLALDRRSPKFSDLIDVILKGISYLLFRLGHAPEVEVIMSLARVFTVFCKIRKDLHTARTFCYDALFCLGLKAYALIFIVLSIWPEVFRRKINGKDADILESSILIALLELKLAQKNPCLKVSPVQNIIKKSYGYQDQLVKSDDLIKKLMLDMRGIKKVEGAESATILLCKKKGWDWTHRNLLCQNLVSIFEDYEWGKVTVNAAADAVKLIGFISRSCSMETSGPVKPIIDYLFEAINKQEKYPMVIQEAIAHSLICLSRFYFHRATNALDLWTPKTYPSEELISKMINLVCVNRIKFWNKHFGQWRRKVRMPKDVLVPNTSGVYCTDADLSTISKNSETDSTKVVSKRTNSLKNRGGKAGHLRGGFRYEGSTSRTVHRNARWVGMLKQESNWLKAEEKKWEEIAWVKGPSLPGAERCEVQKLIEYSDTIFN